MNVRSHVAKPERISLRRAHRLGSGLPSRKIIRQRFRRTVSPRIVILFHASARSPLPFSLGGQPKAAPRLAAEPFAVRNSVEPGDRDHGLLGMRKLRIVPMRWLRVARSGKKLRVFGMGHLALGQREFIEPDAMNRPLVILALLAAHEEKSPGNLYHSRKERGM